MYKQQQFNRISISLCYRQSQGSRTVQYTKTTKTLFRKITALATSLIIVQNTDSLNIHFDHVYFDQELTLWAT